MPLVMKVFEPLTTYSSPSRMAVVAMPARSEPVPGSVMVRLEDLTEIAAQNAEMRREEIARVEKLIGEEVKRITTWTESVPRTRIIRDFRNSMEAIRVEHLNRHAKHFDETTQRVLDSYTRSLVSAMLHGVTSNINAMKADSEEGRRELALARKLLLCCDEDDEETADSQ